jgi:hypothetical protein
MTPFFKRWPRSNSLEPDASTGKNALAALLFRTPPSFM